MSSNRLRARPRVRTLQWLGPVVLVLLAVGPAAVSAEVAGTLAPGDSAYAAGDLVAARDAYAAAAKAEPGDVTVRCRWSRACSELGETQKGDAQRETWAEAVRIAREAVRLAPDSAAPHVWLAVALGRQALREGPRTKLALSKEIKSETDRALELNPGIGRAWHVLAVWNLKVSSLNVVERMAANAVLGGVPKGASMENAEKAFRRAIELEPDYVNHHVEYGRLLKELKRPADARRELELALKLPPTSSALDARYQADARALLEKLPRR